EGRAARGVRLALRVGAVGRAVAVLVEPAGTRLGRREHLARAVAPAAGAHAGLRPAAALADAARPERAAVALAARAERARAALVDAPVAVLVGRAVARLLTGEHRALAAAPHRAAVGEHAPLAACAAEADAHGAGRSVVALALGALEALAALVGRAVA